MTDSESSNINDDDDLVRQYENINDTEDVGEQENNENSSEEVKDKDDNVEKKVDPTAPKKRSTRRLYVLNTDKLKESKGIHTIEKLYEGFKFKGKGHEKEDLDRVMKRLEYWAFRLFPKLDFDDFLNKCEHLGHKKELHTHLKKYRLGMITADNYTQNDIIEDKKDDPDAISTERELLTEITNDEFQKLFDETEQTAKQNL